MNKLNENFEITPPKNQLKLFGYKYYFDSFVNLHKKDKLPNVILLSGKARIKVAADIQPALPPPTIVIFILLPT